MKEILLVCLLIVPGLAFAGNEFCEKAQVATFKLGPGFDAYPESTDFCTLDAENVPWAVKSALLEIVPLNEKIEVYFGLALKNLVPGGLNILVEAGTSASGAYFRPKTIIFTYFRDWNFQTEADFFIARTYIHEFAHLLQLDLATQAPKSIRGLAFRANFFEGYPDFLALRLLKTNKYEFKEPDTICFDWNRNPLPSVNFNQPFEFFTYIDGLEQQRNCCAELDQKDMHSVRSRQACDGRQKSWDGYWAPFFPDLSILKETFDPRKHCFDSKGEYKRELCDDHGIGQVFNSFMFSLEAETNLDIDQIYMRALRGIEHIRRPKFVEFLDEMKKLIPAAQQTAFEKVWAQHTMETAILMDQLQPPAAFTAEFEMTCQR